jgi:hypothetical protein
MQPAFDKEVTYRKKELKMREWDKRSVQMLVWESVPRMQADVWLCF